MCSIFIKLICILFATSLSNIKVFTAVVFNCRKPGFDLINIADILVYELPHTEPTSVRGNKLHRNDGNIHDFYTVV